MNKRTVEISILTDSLLSPFFNSLTVRRFIFIFLLPVCSLLIISCQNSSPSNPTPVNLSGVWEGQLFSSMDAYTTSFCLELVQTDMNLSGTLYILPYDGPLIVTGTWNGNELVLNQQGQMQWVGTVTNGELRGSFTKTTFEGTWKANKQAKDRCNWTGLSTRDRLNRVLTTMVPEPIPDGIYLIPVIPGMTLNLGKNTTEPWPFLIIEFDDSTTGVTMTGVTSTGNNPESGRISALVILTIRIHQQNTELRSMPFLGGTARVDLQIDDGFGGNFPEVYTSVSGTYVIHEDSDRLYEREPLFRSHCENGKESIISLTELTGVSRFLTRNLFNESLTIRIPSEGDFTQIPALHYRIRRCS